MLLPDTPSIPAGTVLDGRFVVEHELGSGGMSRVLAARHVALDRRVAIKLLRPEHVHSPEIVMRFLREARAVARLTNPHVASILDVGTLSTGVPYMVMEHLDGADLASVLRERGRLPPHEALEYYFQILEGIAEAHDAGIVHRDLKPANVFLVARTGQFPLVKVLDFGISKMANPALAHAKDLTAPAAVLGSPLYMSPEQVNDARSVDARGDIWALGVLLYEFLTGRTPFQGTTLAGIMAAITRDRHEPASTLARDVPAPLSRVIDRCLEKDPDRRFASVQDLAAALRAHANSTTAQVTLARILRLGNSVAPMPAAWVPGEAPTDVGEENDTIPRRSAASLLPIHASRRPAQAGKWGASLILVLVASAALGFGIFEARLWFDQRGTAKRTSAGASAAESEAPRRRGEREGSPLELAEVLVMADIARPEVAALPANGSAPPKLTNSGLRVQPAQASASNSPVPAGAAAPLPSTNVKPARPLDTQNPFHTP